MANFYTDIELEEIISKQPLDWMTSILKCQNQEKKTKEVILRLPCS